MKPIKRICRWHKCNAPFVITEAKYKRKLYCCDDCRKARKRWNAQKGQRILEMALAWHESRHNGRILDHNTGKKLTGTQLAYRYGETHPALHEADQLPYLTSFTAMIRDLRGEIEEGRKEGPR